MQWDITDTVISIHALLAESDHYLLQAVSRPCYFYPRSPCGERLRACPVSSPRRYFYPRSPCGERRHLFGNERYRISISIHALLAESDQRQIEFERYSDISIHALLAESDRSKPLSRPRPSKFLSTLSLRRATLGILARRLWYGISIHALLAESDLLTRYTCY